jgi:hypothetical protein
MLEVLFFLFAFGGFWFWGLFGVASLSLILCLERDNEIGATGVFIVTLAALLCLGNASWLTWVFQNPLYFGLGVAGYLLAGVGWGIGKWCVYVRDCNARYYRARREWLEAQVAQDCGTAYVEQCKEALRTGVLAGAVKDTWKHYVKKRTFLDLGKPMIREHKWRVIAQMTYWPWSALWTLINDPVRRFFSWAYERLSGTLQAISNRAFRDIDEELADDDD